MSVYCKAVVADGNGGFAVKNITVNDPQDDEVLVKIRSAGICHTDVDSLNWGHCMVLGHEGAGIVMKAGAGVKSVKPGDSVILTWAMHCGQCFQCRLGNQHLCERCSPVTTGNSAFNDGHAHRDGTLLNGDPISRSFNLGTLSEYTLVKESSVVKNTAIQMPFPSAAIISCGVMTGYGSVIKAAKVVKGSSAAVIGTGGVGLNVIQGAKIAGAEIIIAIDINANRLKMALRFGATHIILSAPGNQGLQETVEKVKSITDGRGADYAFECTAIPQLGAAPLAMVRNAGTAIQVSGIEEEIIIDMNLFEWDKIYINPLYGKCCPQEDIPKIIRLYESGELKLDELVTRTYVIDDLQNAFDDMLQGKNAKGVIVFD